MREKEAQSIRATIHDETTKIQESSRNVAPSDELLNGCRRQQKFIEKDEEKSGKPLHGMYQQQIEEVADIKKSFQWLL